MSQNFLLVLGVALAAAIASPVGGLITLWSRPTTLRLSIAIGIAAGVLLATFTFEMLPKALELASLPIAVGGFALGIAAVYGIDLYVHRGQLAGEEAEQKEKVRRFHRRFRPHGDNTTVLAGGTSAEELIEGLSIGVGAAIDPSFGMLVALAILIDNVSEAMSIGELIYDKRGKGGEAPWKPILGWTSLIGVALFVSAMVGWFLLRNVPEPVLGFLTAMGAGGMFYLTVTDLVPEAEQHQYQQSAGIAVAVGFLAIFILSELSERGGP